MVTTAEPRPQTQVWEQPYDIKDASLAARGIQRIEFVQRPKDADQGFDSCLPTGFEIADRARANAGAFRQSRLGQIPIQAFALNP